MLLSGFKEGKLITILIGSKVEMLVDVGGQETQQLSLKYEDQFNSASSTINHDSNGLIA